MSLTSEEKVLGAVAHFGILFSWVGIIIALTIFLLQKDKSGFASHHAKQALGYQLAAAVLFFVLGLFTAGGMMGGMMMAPQAALPSFMGVFGFWGLLCLAVVGYGIYGAVRALMGKEFRYALIGEFIDRI
ncbi:MAG: DUF4870 domain-containing protein [Peptococcaceae bacterium]|nr:DUF4870 domain-containing protein [Peptococcaceae bacterium]